MAVTAAQQKFCSTCGKQLHIQAEICPHCGVRAMAGPNTGANKVALLLITFFLGGLGAHKFYLKKYGQGILYLLFCWTGITGLIAFVEFIIYCVKSEAELQRIYPETSGVALILAVILSLAGIAMIGIMAAIAIPQFASYRQKAFNSAARSDVQSCRVQAEAYYAENMTYPIRTRQMTCGTSKGVEVYYLSLGANAYQLVAFHEKGNTAYLIGSEEAEISQNSRTEIENQLASRFDLKDGYEGFHFVE